MKWLARRLFNYTANKPCRLIKRPNDEPYMERYWLGQKFGLTFYLHRFVGGDGDDWVHDHPWKVAAGIVLCGSYLEERLTWFDPAIGWSSTFDEFDPFTVNLIKGRDFHKIVHCKLETWTLFIHSPRRKGWGFLQKTPKLTVYHQPYGSNDNQGWHLSAKRGKDIGREPFQL